MIQFSKLDQDSQDSFNQKLRIPPNCKIVETILFDQVDDFDYVDFDQMTVDEKLDNIPDRFLENITSEFIETPECPGVKL